MSDLAIEILKGRIGEKHQGDRKQLEVIFSPSHRLLVEAPAGYGKTNTMVSKIAYMIATGQIPNPKRLLALTFSVNAAYKIKKDVAQQLPVLLADTGINISVKDKVFVSNYHGFCRSLLKKYGSVFHSNLRSIDTLQSVDDTNIEGVQKAFGGITFDDAKFLSDYSDALRKNKTEFLTENFEAYCNLVITELLPNNLISYNGILTLTIKLLKDHAQILTFYRKYFTAVLVDEYQDTNSLSYELLKLLIVDSTKVILLGDSLQRIYGFIGAVPNLLPTSEAFFHLLKIPLEKNYRFASNPAMLQLDANIRRNAENPRNPNISTNAKVDLSIFENQQTEAEFIVKKAVELTMTDGSAKVAILIKQRTENVKKIMEVFNNQGVSFFYGLFSDEDAEYLKFHKKCLFEFIELIRAKNRITKKLASDHIEKLKTEYPPGTTVLSDALLSLLDIFWKKVLAEFSAFSNDDKVVLIKDTFEYNGLKQYVEFVSSNIVISTVHGAKGLEWDFVILPDLEQDSFPSFMSLCGPCTCKTSCRLIITDSNEEKFLEDLSVFYVAVTRARRQIYFSASKKSLDRQGRERPKNLSCLLGLKGIEY